MSIDKIRNYLPTINPNYGRIIPVIAMELFNSTKKERKFQIAAVYFTVIPVLLILIGRSSDVVQSGSGIALFYAQTNTLAAIKTFYLSFFLGQILLVILTADQIAGEIEMKTFNFIRSKAVFDSEIVFGKFLGMMLIIAVLDIPALLIIYFSFLVNLKAEYPEAYIGTLDEITAVIFFVLLLQGVIIALTLFFSTVFNRSLYAILSSMLSLFILSTIADNVEKNNYISMDWLLDAALPNIFYHLEPLEGEIPTLLGLVGGIFAVLVGLLLITVLALRRKEIQ